MTELFSIPVTTVSVGEYRLKVDWIIAEEAEAALARHHPGLGVTLDTLFRHRLTFDYLPHGWDWLLVVLPGRYPIGGYLAEARGGPKTNMILVDQPLAMTSTTKLEERWSGSASTHPLFFPGRPRTDLDVYVSIIWVASKGLLRSMAATAGGWLTEVAARVASVPATGCWVYMAEAPSDDFIASVRGDNAARYEAWQRRYTGPDWHTNEHRDHAWSLSCALEASGPQRLRFLKAYLRRHPGDARAWALRAVTHDILRQPVWAAAAAKRALAQAPDWQFARRLCAFLLVNAGYMAEGVARYRELLAGSPLNLGARLEWSMSLLYLGKEEERSRCLQSLIELHPRPSPFFVEQGVILYRQGDAKSALHCFEQAVLLDPENPLALNNYGFLLAEKGELDKALMLCRRACELQETANHLDSLGFVYMRMGDLTKARELIGRAMAMDEHHVESREHWAELERMTGG